MLEAVAGAPTLVAAAQQLSVTPSALTHRLQEAERRLGCRLVARGAGAVRLTEAGQRLLTTARSCLRELDEAEREVAAAGTLARDTVRLGASTLSGYEWLPQLLARVEAELPTVEVEMAMEASLHPLRALQERTIDLAVVPTAARGRGLRCLRLFRDEMVALVAEGHARCARGYVELGELAAEPYVADATVIEPGREYERLFAPAGIRPTRVVRAGHMAAVVSLVRAGLGVTIATRTSVAPYLGTGGFVPLRLGPRGHFLTWYAVVRGARRNPAWRVAEMLADSPR